MIYLKSAFALLFAVVTANCTSTKTNTNTSEAETENQTEIMASEKKMIEEGYKKGTIVFSKVEGDCPYTIKVEGDPVLYDPQNLDASFEKHGKKVWFTYTGLRKMNRCEKAIPVEILVIQKRMQ